MSESKATDAAEAPLRGVRVRNLSVERGGRRVLHDLSFALGPGDLLAVTGANGAGKSTLLRAMAGLLGAVSGAIEGVPPTADVIENAHYVGPLDALKPTLTVAENLAFWQAVLVARAAGATLDRALERLGLRALADLPAAYLSAGQRRRLALGRLVAAPRPLWLLDEPTNALDAEAQFTLDALIADHLAGGGVAMVATHAPLRRATKQLALRA